MGESAQASVLGLEQVLVQVSVLGLEQALVQVSVLGSEQASVQGLTLVPVSRLELAPVLEPE